MIARLLKTAALWLRWRWAKPPHAVQSFADGFAQVCAYCDSKHAADNWSWAHGLRASHGICPACVPKLISDVDFEAGERCAAPGSVGKQSYAARGTATGVPSGLVKPSCRSGGGPR
jgi:hypothetical protein